MKTMLIKRLSSFNEFPMKLIEERVSTETIISLSMSFSRTSNEEKRIFHRTDRSIRKKILQIDSSSFIINEIDALSEKRKIPIRNLLNTNLFR